MTVYIYSLVDPRDGACRYVGKTCHLKMRLNSHLHKHRKDYKSNWVKSLAALGINPRMEILETIENSNDEDWQDRERFWISEMRRRGFSLTNLDIGGKAGKRLCESTKKKLSEINTGKKLSDEAKKKMSDARKGVPFTPEHAAKIGEANRGRPVSEETRNKMRIANSGRTATPEQRAAASERTKARWARGDFSMTPEIRAKISATLIRNQYDKVTSGDSKDDDGFIIVI